MIAQELHGMVLPNLHKYMERIWAGLRQEDLARLAPVAHGELTTAQIVSALAEILSEAPDTLVEKLISKVVQLKQLGMLTFVEPVAL
ncbi:hypothetical protein HMPREF3167_04735 [Trueperella sp. HMSC08B05]|uniref:Uncharacterized protein n=1 Tax=Trueperella bernardiae TaxID=59561 RepID=A0AAW6ZAE7_9ACTO|nr:MULTISPECIES: hypothetical protein [Trueperella]MDK8600976.1 hypothetical protein [Trueperella bernardiae]OCW60059.1 hypothetical protein AKG36_07095 [Trueperella bernardiae]OFS66188.1 hypothetical protein HMPREF3174_06250 [Trueperella sp. HMSC08H06]OFS74715.1 hypothetical protein HMPREF3167_04735 [Trueperella sp. HMSC08B05]PKZ89167.1 hypothetical protein CYK24_05505 [Trueperella bernardiae]